jgi:SAM-dependent methyltransferase
MDTFRSEEERIKQVYAARDDSGKRQIYAWSEPNVHYMQWRIQQAVAGLLAANGAGQLGSLEVLDVGCGSGGWLRMLQEWGATPEGLHGIDLLADRIAEAKRKAPHLDYRIATGWGIPFADASMDMVCANTVFSSILDANARCGLGGEMMRVVRPSGAVLLFDFVVGNPANRDTLGIGRAEVQRIFPGWKVSSRRIILAPPILRRTIRLGAAVPLLLESLLPMLRTHAVYLLQKKD